MIIVFFCSPVYLFIYLFIYFSSPFFFFSKFISTHVSKKKKSTLSRSFRFSIDTTRRAAYYFEIGTRHFSISLWEGRRRVESGGRELLAIYLIGPTSIADRDGRVNWCTNENGLKIYIDRDNVNGNSLNNWSFDHPALLHFYPANQSVFKRASPTRCFVRKFHKCSKIFLSEKDFWELALNFSSFELLGKKFSSKLITDFQLIFDTCIYKGIKYSFPSFKKRKTKHYKIFPSLYPNKIFFYLT